MRVEPKPLDWSSVLACAPADKLALLEQAQKRGVRVYPLDRGRVRLVTPTKSRIFTTLISITWSDIQ